LCGRRWHGSAARTDGSRVQRRAPGRDRSSGLGRPGWGRLLWLGGGLRDRRRRGSNC
jgi:hypothetical protein